MGNRSQYPNVVVMGGVLKQVAEHPLSKAGGRKLKGVIFNPSLVRETFDTYAPFTSVGNRLAERILEYSTSQATVVVTASLSTVRKFGEQEQVELFILDVTGAD